jgi:hypothetical protein
MGEMRCVHSVLVRKFEGDYFRKNPYAFKKGDIKIDLI